MHPPKRTFSSQQHLCFVNPATFVDHAASGRCSKETCCEPHTFCLITAYLVLPPQTPDFIFDTSVSRPLQFSNNTVPFSILNSIWHIFCVYVRCNWQHTALLFHALNSQISFKREKKRTSLTFNKFLISPVGFCLPTNPFLSILKTYFTIEKIPQFLLIRKCLYLTLTIEVHF